VVDNIVVVVCEISVDHGTLDGSLNVWRWLECNQPDIAQPGDLGVSIDIVGFDFHDQIEVSTGEKEYLAGTGKWMRGKTLDSQPCLTLAATT
jgi:hypothetical protein